MVQVIVHGEVELFLSDPKRRHGFIRGDDGITYFFHFNNLRAPLILEDDEVAWLIAPSEVLHLPRHRGDRVVFQVGPGGSGKKPEAKRWTYEEVYREEERKRDRDEAS